MPSFGDYQNEIYFCGLNGVKPKLPVDFKALEQRARAAMPESVLSYVAGGCGDERTQDFNVSAFQKWGLVPRMMVDCSKRDLSVDLFGLKLPSPLFMSPIGVLGICAQDGHGDLAAAKAAALSGVPMIASTLSNDPLEAVAEAIGAGTGFFQLYTPTDRELAESFVCRAEAAGFKALVVTLDTATLGWRPRDLNDANFPQLHGHALVNYFSDPRFRALLGKPPEEDRRTAAQLVLRIFGKPLTWADLPWLRSLTKLPLILKGICHPDDARRARDGGGPALIEALTYRHGGHSRADPGKYRPDDEVKQWLAKDPLPAYREVLTARGIDAAVLDAIDKNAREAVDRATEEAKAGREPRLELASTNVWADGGHAWRN